MAHKHADVLKAIADGKQVQYMSDSSIGWKTPNLDFINPITSPGLSWRVAAPTAISVNGVTVTPSDSDKLTPYGLLITAFDDTVDLTIAMMVEHFDTKEDLMMAFKACAKPFLVQPHKEQK